MPVDESLAERVRAHLKNRRVEEKKMFGGLCFMVNGHMCCGVESDRLVIRIGPDAYDKALDRKYASPMNFTGRPLKGFVYVSKAGVKTTAAMASWLDSALAFVENLPSKSKKNRRGK